MKIDYNIPDNRVEISEFELIVSDEAFTGDELAWLHDQMWLLASTTKSERLAAFASHAQCVFAALNNDTDAIILRRSDENNE
jgi:hypothetical protein